MKLKQLISGVFAVSCLAVVSAQAEVSELKITKQPSIAYLPGVIMEHDKLIEKHAKQLGLSDLKVSWVTMTSGGAATDALLSGQIQMVYSGTSNMLLLWDRTKGGVKGIVSGSATPLWLLTRDPRVKSIKDFTDKDKIAVPTIKVSTQAMLLQMAAEKAYGPAGTHKLDPLTVALGHPDAMAALSNPTSEINSHFSISPYQEQEIKMPGVHRVLTSTEILGGPYSNTIFFGTTKFHHANPKTVKAFRAALEEADALIKKDPRAAAQKYLDVTHEKYSVNDLVNIIKNSGAIFSPAPYGTMKFATFMAKEGMLKKKPTSWKDVYFSEAHNLPGN